MSAAVAEESKGGWLPLVLFAVVFIGCLVAACIVSEVGREVVAKAVRFIVGLISTPFILEATVALCGLFVVLGINHWRMEKEGDGWVYLAVNEPNSTSVAENVNTGPHRLDGLDLEQKPNFSEDFEGRVAMAEGYLELGLAREAMEHLQQLSAEERATDRVRRLLVTAESRLA